MRNFRVGILCVVLVLIYSVSLAKKDEINIYEMPCPMEQGEEFCSPTDCTAWCNAADADGGFECQLGVFQGDLIIKLACCYCSEEQTHWGAENDPETCNSNADCQDGYVCVGSAAATPSSLLMLKMKKTPAMKLPPKFTAPKKYCTSEQAVQGTPTCVQNSDCGEEALCRKGNCFAY